MKALYALWYFSANGQMMRVYTSSMVSSQRFERTLAILCTFFASWYLRSAFMTSSSATRRLDRSTYPASHAAPSRPPTLLLVHTRHHARLHLSNLNELGNGANATTRQLRRGNKALDAVVLQKRDVDAAVRDSRSHERCKETSYFSTFTITTSSTFGNSFA